MAVERIACPACGAPLDVADDAVQAKCQYCGASLRLNFGPPPDTGVEPDGTIRDQATGQGLFTGSWPKGWRVVVRSLSMYNDTSRPYAPLVVLTHGSGQMVFLVGAAGTRWGLVMKGMTAMYGGHLQGTDRTNYADMPNPVRLADEAADGARSSKGGEGIRLVQQLSLPNLAQRQQQTLARFQRFVDCPLKDPFVAEVLRVYEFTADGQTWRIASYARLGAVIMDFGMPGLTAAGGLLGIIGLADQAQRRRNSGSMRPAAEFADSWRTHDQATYAKGENISWGVDLVGTLVAPADGFGTLLDEFVNTTLSVRMHPDIDNLTLQAIRQQDAAIQQSTQSALARQQAAFQAQQQAHRELEAAMDARNASWQAQQDAHHASVMSSGSGGGSSPDFSEAIRGVNTYTTSDGREVQISVQADHAWENQGGDVIGTQGSFDPGYDWTELPRQ